MSYCGRLQSERDSLTFERCVCGEDATDVGSLGRWVRCFRSGQRDIGNRPHGSDDGDQRQGWCAASQVNCAPQYGTGKLEVMAVIRELGYRNFAQGGCWKCSPSNGRQPEKHLCRTERDGDDLISTMKPGLIVTTRWRKDINVINAISRR